MLADTQVFSAFAVDDLAEARKFYGETRGVRVSEQHGLQWTATSQVNPLGEGERQCAN